MSPNASPLSRRSCWPGSAVCPTRWSRAACRSRCSAGSRTSGLSGCGCGWFAPRRSKLAARLADVGARAVPVLLEAWPEIPDELGDRAGDCAEPLLAIADLAGGNWPVLARKSLVALQGGRSIEDESASTRLLADVRAVFGDRERVSSRELLKGLHELEEAPWGDWFSKPLSAAKLNRLLHDFSIHSGDVWVEVDGERKSLKGFKREQFEDAWARYLHPEPREGENPLPERDCGGFENARAHPLSRHETGRKPAPQAGSRGLAAETAEPGLIEGTVAAEGLVEGASTATDADEAEVERVRAKFRDEDGLDDLWPDRDEDGLDDLWPDRDEDGLDDLWPDQPYRRFLEEQRGEK